MRRPAGLDRKTALRVRQDVLKGRRVGDPELRPAAEFYVERISRSFDRQRNLRPINIALAVIFTALVFLDLIVGTRSLWGSATVGLCALSFAGNALAGPSLRRKYRRRLEVNRPSIDGST